MAAARTSNATVTVKLAKAGRRLTLTECSLPFIDSYPFLPPVSHSPPQANKRQRWRDRRVSRVGVRCGLQGPLTSMSGPVSNRCLRRTIIAQYGPAVNPPALPPGWYIASPLISVQRVVRHVCMALLPSLHPPLDRIEHLCYAGAVYTSRITTLGSQYHASSAHRPCCGAAAGNRPPHPACLRAFRRSGPQNPVQTTTGPHHGKYPLTTCRYPPVTGPGKAPDSDVVRRPPSIVLRPSLPISPTPCALGGNDIGQVPGLCYNPVGPG